MDGPLFVTKVELHVTFVNVMKHQHRGFYFFPLHNYPAATETAYTLCAESPCVNP